jgi:hypothetical protein
MRKERLVKTLGRVSETEGREGSGEEEEEEEERRGEEKKDEDQLN